MKSGLKFFEVDQIRKGQGTVIPSLNVQEIAKEVLALLPEMKKLDEETFKVCVAGCQIDSKIIVNYWTASLDKSKLYEVNVD